MKSDYWGPELIYSNWIALCGGIVLEEALDLSSDRLLNNNNNNHHKLCQSSV